MAWNRDIEKWDPEDTELWEREGKWIASRNLWISIPCLLVAFGFWQMWGMVTVQMSNLGFPFSGTELFTLVAIAGLSGATLRIPASFMIRIAGGRNTIACTTALMIIPCIGAYFALQNQDTPLWVFQLLALLSGVGGGNFACSMANISTFFPKRQQGLALGLNAGLGNLGVTGMQILIPLVMTAAVFGALSGAPMVLESSSGTIFGSIPEGTETWLQNPALFGVLVLVPLTLAAWFGMNNLRTVTPEPGNPLVAFGKIIGLYNLAFVTSAIGLYLFLPRPVGLELLNMWLALPLIILLTLGALRLLPGAIQPNIKRQFAIFRDRHTWSMTVLYIATFGSFIGFSAALPLSIEVIFGSMTVDGERVPNPDAPSALTFAWIGPFVGAAIRPVGGWISDKLGGSLVTQIISGVMVVASVAVGYVMMLAYQSANPTDYFWLFLVLFLVIFAACGAGNGSTFRTVGVLFSQEQKGPVLGWTSAIAAYGAFIAPRVMGEQIEAGNPELAMYGFAAFYAVGMVINHWFYLRRNAYAKNP
ncbi:MFS transporter [Aquisalimonas sp.]|uniref:MFS transporter n=1 Tax=Aquisalimonas sp. TaxID=1872621 RepID=UPI0025C3E062|nr:MFS transporter [Aquisalimonas sp.]